ncbi:SRPBCC family protein [Vogesella facilis]|uniref:SRPBCC family protein n=1 Tax=Vogesella facilis TaxID=1655232 RepID=A0ABV7RKJ2_9NEIS
MSTPSPLAARELQLTRLLPASPATVYRAWTEPALLQQWFAPLPYTTPHVELDVRPGGRSLVVMRDPDGNDYPNAGVYLEVIPNQKLVVTDAYSEAWLPAEKPFMTLILTFAAEAGGTRYTALVRHWSVADREAHEAMGFHAGWGQTTDQLAALLARL